MPPEEDPGVRVAGALAREPNGLLVLDNLEQAAGPELTAAITQWKGAAPGLGFAGTSRVRLGLEDEMVIELRPLSDTEGVTLYADRARAVGYPLRGAEHDDARDLVRRLDGVPLAIELAAARAPVLPPSQLISRLDQALELLEGAQPRSLKTTFDLSFSLLGREEADMLLGLALFRSTFSLCRRRRHVRRHGIPPLASAS